MNARIVRGFTLIEIMVAVGIIAILAGVALPSYLDHLRKAKRAEGKSALLKALQLEERAYTAASANAAYVTDLGPLFGLGAGAVVKSGEDPRNGNYTITAAADPAAGNDLQAGVLLTATPAAPFTDANPVTGQVDCGVLTINAQGVKTSSGAKPLSFCWDR
jgi:type IV pilus assembly protein PilE